MAIHWNGHKITGVYLGSKEIKEIYQGQRLIYPDKNDNNNPTVTLVYDVKETIDGNSNEYQIAVTGNPQTFFLNSVDNKLSLILPSDTSKPITVHDARDASNTSLNTGYALTYEADDQSWKTTIRRTNGTKVEITTELKEEDGNFTAYFHSNDGIITKKFNVELGRYNQEFIEIVNDLEFKFELTARETDEWATNSVYLDDSYAYFKEFYNEEDTPVVGCLQTYDGNNIPTVSSRPQEIHILLNGFEAIDVYNVKFLSDRYATVFRDESLEDTIYPGETTKTIPVTTLDKDAFNVSNVRFILTNIKWDGDSSTMPVPMTTKLHYYCTAEGDVSSTIRNGYVDYFGVTYSPSDGKQDWSTGSFGYYQEVSKTNPTRVNLYYGIYDP